MDQIELGKKIHELRKLKGLTQEELSDRTGLSTRTIQRIENGEVYARTYTLNKLADALQVELSELLNVEEDDGLRNKMSDNDTRKWLALFHLSGLFTLIAPSIIFWIIKRDDVPAMNEHAKNILNFQLSMIIYFIISGFLVFLIIGLPIAIFLAIFSQLMVIINCIKVLQGSIYRYPLTIQILKNI